MGTVSAPLVSATVQQIKSMVLVIRLSAVQLEDVYGEVARDVLNDLDSALERLEAIFNRAARSANGLHPPGKDNGICEVSGYLRTAQRRYARLFEPEVSFVLEVPEEPAVVEVPAALIERMVLDLLLRARDVTQVGGAVKARVEIGDGFVRIVVQDGHRAGHDSGLDLVAYWTKVLGIGKVTLESRPGQGSIFSIVLPLSAQAD